MITLSTLCETFDVHPEAIETITSQPNSKEANQVILNYIIFITKGDQQMNAFCDLMIKLINNPKLSKITKILKSGMYICTYVVLEITVDHWPFSDQFQHLADQIHFGGPILLYIFNGMAINNLLNVLLSLKKKVDQFMTLISTTAYVCICNVRLM